jgi:acetyl-CoA carboxylase carboxyl transferase subunit alpha
MSAKDLLSHKLIDDIVPEPLGGAHQMHEETARNLQNALNKHLSALEKLDRDELVNQRYERYRQMGEFKEA